jgi:hypothetical protein
MCQLSSIFQQIFANYLPSFMNFSYQQFSANDLPSNSKISFQ